MNDIQKIVPIVALKSVSLGEVYREYGMIENMINSPA